MQSFLDYARLSDELYEQAYNRNKIFREVESKERQIYNHLLKVLFYNDSYNNEKTSKRHRNLVNRYPAYENKIFLANKRYVFQYSLCRYRRRL